MTCPHDLAERETGVADGMCPLCLAAEIKQLKQQNERLWAALQKIELFPGYAAADIARRALDDAR
jgi:hypothetical protein